MCVQQYLNFGFEFKLSMYIKWAYDTVWTTKIGIVLRSYLALSVTAFTVVPSFGS